MADAVTAVDSTRAPWPGPPSLDPPTVPRRAAEVETTERPPSGTLEQMHHLLGRARTTFANTRDALAPYLMRPLPAPPVTNYPAQPKSLREAFVAIPGTSAARTRQFSRNVESWASTWDMLGRAEKSVDSSYFIVERDIFGFSFLGNLMRHQRAGRPVRLMMDATADFNGVHGFTQQVALAWPPQMGGQDYLQELAAAGSHVAVYHPIWQHLLRLPDAVFANTSGIAATDHDKILVVDGKTGKTGGRNIARDYFVDPVDLPAAWRDGDSEIRGEGPAKALTTAFERELNSRVASRVTPDLLGNRTPRDIELIGAYHLMDMWMHESALSPADATALRGDTARRSAMAASLVERAVAKLPADGITRAPDARERESLLKMATELVGYTRTRGASTTYDREANFFDAEVKILDQTSVAAGRYNEIAPAYTALVRGAQKGERIVIENPYVVLTEEEIKELEAASKRGVEIWFGTNSPLSTDSSVTQAFFLLDWPYILARVPTARFFVATGTHKFHDKMAVLGDSVSVVSSYNADWLSAYVNSEIADVSWSKERAASLLQSFHEDLVDPENGVREYTIKRNPDGSPVLVDRNAGSGRAPDWQPVVEFGPEHHLPTKIMDEYKKRMTDWDRRRRELPQLAPLRHPPLRGPGTAQPQVR